MMLIARWQEKFRTDEYDFDPDILRLQHQAPSPLPRAILWSLLALLFSLLLWAIIGRLDIVAVANGKLVPQSSLKIVQPSEAGIIKEILVGEGDVVREGQVVARMDAVFSDADRRSVENELKLKELQLRRVDAELDGGPLLQLADDPDDLFEQVQEQYRAHRQAYADALGTERAVRDKAEQDLQGAKAIERKLRQTLPMYRQQSEAFHKLDEKGYVSKLMASEKERELIEKEQDLRAQQHTVKSLKAAIAQADRQLSQITSTYMKELQNERVATEGEFRKLQQEAEKQVHRNELLELRAPQDGIVKDLSTHTPGTVVSPGTILMTVVPTNDPMEAEVWVTHLDAGFVEVGQHALVKLSAYPFQKYGMVEGEVSEISPDASDPEETKRMDQQGYKAVVRLKQNHLEVNGRHYGFTPGMQVSAEINLGDRSVLEYLLSPVQKTVLEAGHER